MKTDKTTGEPILSPKLSADQLHAMADDPGWRPWIHLIANHPNAWPELADWCRSAMEHGFDTVGAAPMPPEPSRRRGRFAIPTAPLPPEDHREPDTQPIPQTTRQDEDATDALADRQEPGPAEPDREAAGDGDDEPEKEEQESEPAHDAMEEADGDWTLIDDPYADEPATTVPNAWATPESVDTEKPTAYEPDPFDDIFTDTEIHHEIPWKRIIIGILTALITITLITGGVMLSHHHSEETTRQARAQAAAECAQARTKAGKQRDALEQAKKKAKELATSTKPGGVADPATITRLNKLAGQDIKELPTCPASSPDPAAMRSTGSAYKATTEKINAAVKAVEESRVDKTVDQAKKLLNDSEGKVADNKTRVALTRAIQTRDEKAMQKATRQVNDSMAAKKKADQKQAEQMKAAAAKAKARKQTQSTQTTTPRYSTGSTYSGGGSYRRYSGSGTSGSAGGTTRRSSGSTSTGGGQKTPSKSNNGSKPGWSVPKPSTGTGMPNNDPGL